tara:strand:- start:3761 stop:4195 length:435 start_codon:yes stop_codon:yes gene_type:complete
VSTLRNLNRFIARLLIGVLVFAQVAVAAYACPAMSTGSVSGEPGHSAPMGMGQGIASAMGVGGMPDGARVDPSQPNLCAAHCQTGQQNADGRPAPTVPPALLASLYPVVPAAPRTQLALARAAVDDPPPAASPPLAILHCCFRI